nr:retrotransposon protein, putative, Ty1-copia subclass [Tanacetum cinerariifolium]
MFLVYGGDLKRELRVSCYTDAGYLTEADDLKSQTGYVFVLNGGAVDWKSAKQSIFATSSAEAEYIAAFDASNEARSVKCIFVGYPKKTMGYYFYFPPKNKVIVARYGNFLERDLIPQKFSGRDNDLEDDHMDTLPSENTSEIPVESESLGSPPELIPVCRSERTKRAPNRLCLNIEVEDDELEDLGEPGNYKAPMLDPDKVIWQGAVDEEMNSMKVMKVWIVVDLPPNAKVVRSKWLYKKKTNMDDIRAIRILIAIAAYYDYEIWQIDVKTAFLNGRLDKDIYMEQPKGYVDPNYPNRVCKLQRSIYGLKQASRQWNKRFDEEIKKFGFIQNRDEPCVYRKAGRSDVVFLILYVDDILIMGNNIPRLKEVKDYLGKSTRTRHAPDRMCLYIDAEEHELGDLGEPVSYKAALLDPDKWLFKKKTDIDGNVHIYKARLVAKGFTQTPGIDYEETFSQVVDIRAIRILIAIAAYYDYEIWQMDVKTAFLNGYLNEEQASRQWNKRFDDEIKKFGFTQNRDEPCVYIKASGSNITFLILYVDDILLMGNSIPMLQSVKTYLGKCFAMKDLGEAAYILGIKIYRDRSKRLTGLCQSAYIEKILKRYSMENSKRGSIPMQEKLKLSKSQGASTPAEMKRMQNVPYASAVGSIMFGLASGRARLTCLCEHS